jgi:predicted phage terminase large subunit-like protein
MRNDPRLRACLRAKQSLLAFSSLSLRTFSPGRHHRVLCRELEMLERGETDRLMVMMPPRHGKSELCSVRFPAWFMGRSPQSRIIACSYSESLAESFSRRVRDLAGSDVFRAVFPMLRLKKGAGAAVRWETEAGGKYLAAGAGGSITGQGGDLIIIDDPVKNSEQASSPVYREKLWEWYQSTLFTRLEKGGRIVLVQTRWHEDDLAGRLLSSSKEKWRTVSFPAVAEQDEDFRQTGEALWPEKYSKPDLERIKEAVGSRVWNALYQQTPSPDSGEVFKREWWRYYGALPSVVDSWVQSWDMSFKATAASDYVVGQVWAVKGAQRYLVDMVRGRMDFAATVRAVRNLSAAYPQAAAKYVEDKANGSAVISALSREIQGLVPVEPRGSKTVRAYSVQPLLEAGNVLLPEGKGFTHELVEEATAFPFGKHDDMVDAMTQALEQTGLRNSRPAGHGAGARRQAGNIFRGY